MQYISHYVSPLGEILLAADEIGLTGLWFAEQKHFAAGLKAYTQQETPLLKQAKRWLDVYFSGQVPDFQPPLHFSGTAFQTAVWEILSTIPYGQTTTYGQIADQLAVQKCLSSMSAQAVGGAVGRNPISIIVPCHRVVGSNGSLTGYAGGIQKKIALLKLEGVDTSMFSIPRHPAAP